jgi:metal-sulfur cluster biosynthetic enzyme
MTGTADIPQMSAMTETEVRKILDSIVDPCSRAAGAPAGISEMGMVPDIGFSQGEGNQTDITVRLIVTHPFCMMSAMFVREIAERLEVQPGVGSATVDFDPGTLWSPDLMKPEYAARLEAARAKRKAEYAAKKAEKILERTS